MLARKRTSRFHNRKELTVSSRTYDGIGIDAEVFGAIDDDGERGEGADQIYYWSLACLKCGEFQYPEFKHFKFEDNNPSTVEYECGFCGHRHTRADELRVKESGDYILDRDEGVDVVACFANAWAVKMADWAEIVDEFLQAKGDPAKLQVVVNTSFNEVWHDQAGEGIQGNIVYERRETYPAEVPKQVKVLTFGADIQADRIECEIVGWDESEESWSVDYEIFDGDPNFNEVWSEFGEYLDTEFSHESGGAIKISAGVIDAGYLPSRANEFIRKRRSRFIWSGIGRAGKRPLVEPRVERQKRLRRSRSKKKKHEIIGIDEGKSILYGRLRLKPCPDPVAGYCHFPINDKYDPEHFEQLTAERVVRKMLAGQVSRQWKLKSAGTRNEALDCRVYAHAALRLYEPKWGRLKLSEKKPETKPDQPKSTTRKPRRPARRRGGYVKAW